jgi:CBS-domain-containing membrane protein
MAESDIATGQRLGVGRAVVAWLRSRAWRTAIMAGLGAAVAIAILAHANAQGVMTLLVAPFGATCALIFGAPASPLAQPRNVIGGHLVAGLCGLVAFKLIGDAPTAMAAGVGLAIAGMLLTETLHPPAGANPIVLVFAAANWSFLAAPLLVGSAVIVAVGMGYHRWVTHRPYPA